MKQLKLTIILLTIIGLCIAGYFSSIKYGSGNNKTIERISHGNISQTPSTNSYCKKNQLSATIETEGAAGNIYGTLTLTNISKTSCTITLGNTITAMFSTGNMILHYKQAVPSESFSLAPSAKVYSQIHYPNGPQCQSGILQQPITFFYKTNQTTKTFTLTKQTGKLLVQACKSPNEQTLIDIWPLSKTPVTP
jgi:Domain of unknown function (DUF4232)